jgi:hypothetical protein
MGELYERILSQHPRQTPHPDSKNKILTDVLQACIRLQRAGIMTVDQIDALFELHTGSALGTAATGDDAGRQEVLDLIATVPTGTTTTNRLDRIERLALIEAVLVVSDLTPPVAPLHTPAGIRTALGVQDRS